MAKPTTRAEFRAYCLRKLGAPVLRINVDDSQIEDRIDEALTYFSDYHADFSRRAFMKVTLTQTDIDNGYVTIPEEVQHILKVFKIGSITGGSSSDLFSVNYQYSAPEIMAIINGSSAGLGTYVATFTNLSMLDDLLSVYPTFEFRRHENILYITRGLQSFAPGDFVLIECHVWLADTSDRWGDRDFSRYAAALIKKQWGWNLLKFAGVSLAGGVQMNGQAILDEANKEIEEMEADFQTKYEMPPLPFIG